MLSEEEREIVEELLEKYLVSPETIAHLLQYRRHLPSQSEKGRVLPHFMELMKDVLILRGFELKRKAVNAALDKERRREASSVGEPF